MGLLKALTGILSAVLLAACSTNPPAPDAKDPLAMQLIATDLVHTLVQIRSIAVPDTTLSLPEENFSGDNFGNALQERLEQVGYAVRTVGSSPSDKSVSYTIQPGEITSDGRDTSTFTVSIGSVSVRRTYTNTDSADVHPTAEMLVKGADATSLRISNSIFGPSSPVAELEEPATGNQARSELSSETPVDAVPAEPVAGVQLSDPGDIRDAAVLARLQRRPLTNFRELKRSNFSDLFDSLVLVRETIVPFGNDSIELDGTARALIASLVDDFDIERDVFSVIGCSNGATSVASGPKGLALGRAADVTAVLVSLGVPRQSVLEEGCWSDEHFDEMMPRRGVVLSLQRYPVS